MFAMTVDQLLFKNAVIAVSPWTFNEFSQHGSDAAAEREAYFGIVRSDLDYTLKPVATRLRRWYTTSLFV